jgi:fructokinase
MADEEDRLMPVWGAIEAGGTKFRCAVADTATALLDEATFPTRRPAETMADVLGFFTGAAAVFGKISALGVGSFGPLDLDPASPGYGSIVRTPKPHWSDFNLRAALMEQLACPVSIDTDVNASGLAESLVGAGRGLPSLAYITIGTGIGGGLIRQGRALHGFTHPEMGHVRPRRAAGDVFAGICPFHGDCLEGLASGAAIFARGGRHLADTPSGDPVWGYLAEYIAQLCSALLLFSAPHRIVLGGGVMSSNPGLFAPIRQAAAQQLAGYLSALSLDEVIVPPALGKDSGLIGGLLMAGAKT